MLEHPTALPKSQPVLGRSHSWLYAILHHRPCASGLVAATKPHARTAEHSPGLIPAAGYLRRSTSKQEKSLDDQRAEIERYAAAHGYRIVAWFIDDGISGDATDRRTGFLAMHKAACNGRNFDAILVWNSDRFGRFDSMEAGFWIHKRNSIVPL